MLSTLCIQTGIAVTQTCVRTQLFICHQSSVPQHRFPCAGTLQPKLHLVLHVLCQDTEAWFGLGMKPSSGSGFGILGEDLRVSPHPARIWSLRGYFVGGEGGNRTHGQMDKKISLSPGAPALHLLSVLFPAGPVLACSSGSTGCQQGADCLQPASRER